MSQRKIVLDTNILVSALINDEGHEAVIFNLVLGQILQLCAYNVIIAEYERVLYRAKLKLNLQLVKSVLSFCRSSSTIVTPALSVPVSPHDADNRFLEYAEAAEADYLVTGNKRHFPERWKRTEVVNARELLNRLNLAP